MKPHEWGAAFKKLLEERGVKTGQGARNDRTSAKVAEVAKEVGVPERTAQRRLEQAKLYESLPPAKLRAEDARKWTQAKVAAALGVAQQTVSDWFDDATNRKSPNGCAPDARVKVNPRAKPAIAARVAACMPRSISRTILRSACNLLVSGCSRP